VKLNPPPVNVIPPLNVTDIYYSFYYKLISLAAAKLALPTLNGPRTDAVAVSVANVILSTVDLFAGPPPPNQPSVVLPAAANAYLAAVNGPRTLAVAVSVAYVILSTVEIVPIPEVYPPPNHPSVLLPVAPCRYLPALSGPRTLAVTVSFANVILSTVDLDGFGRPPPHHP
jgi:hypothetical protein